MAATYTVGARVQCNADPHLHVTMAFVGECDEARLDELRRALGELSQHPIQCALGEHALFGPRNDVPVIQCAMVHAHVTALWQSFYDQYAQRPPGWTEPKLVKPNYHVTIKNPRVAEEFAHKKAIDCTEIFLKQLGPHDPLYQWSLPQA